MGRFGIMFGPLLEGRLSDACWVAPIGPLGVLRRHVGSLCVSLGSMFVPNGAPESAHGAPADQIHQDANATISDRSAPNETKEEMIQYYMRRQA